MDDLDRFVVSLADLEDLDDGVALSIAHLAKKKKASGWEKWRGKGGGGRRSFHSAEDLALAVRTATDVTELKAGSSMLAMTITSGPNGRAVTKDFGGPGRSMDSEYLGTKAMEALGAPVARAVKLDETTLAYDYVDGEDMTDHWNDNVYPVVESDTMRDASDTPEARSLGLADYVTQNGDRHSGNFLVVDGRPVGIDHGELFGGDVGSPFAYRWIKTSIEIDDATGRIWTYEVEHDFTDGELSAARTAVESLRPEFEAAGRGEWVDSMHLRIDRLEARSWKEQR